MEGKVRPAPNYIYLEETDTAMDFDNPMLGNPGEPVWEYVLSRTGKYGKDGKPKWFGKRGAN